MWTLNLYLAHEKFLIWRFGKYKIGYLIFCSYMFFDENPFMLWNNKCLNHYRPTKCISHCLCLNCTTANDTLLHIRYEYRNSSVRYFVHFCFCVIRITHLPSIIHLFLYLSHSRSLCDIWMSYAPFPHIKYCWYMFNILLPQSILQNQRK